MTKELEYVKGKLQDRGQQGITTAAGEEIHLSLDERLSEERVAPSLPLSAGVQEVDEEILNNDDNDNPEDTCEEKEQQSDEAMITLIETINVPSTDQFRHGKIKVVSLSSGKKSSINDTDIDIIVNNNGGQEEHPQIDNESSDNLSAVFNQDESPSPSALYCESSIHNTPGQDQPPQLLLPQDISQCDTSNIIASSELEESVTVLAPVVVAPTTATNASNQLTFAEETTARDLRFIQRKLTYLGRFVRREIEKREERVEATKNSTKNSTQNMKYENRKSSKNQPQRDEKNQLRVLNEEQLNAFLEQNNLLMASPKKEVQSKVKVVKAVTSSLSKMPLLQPKRVPSRCLACFHPPPSSCCSSSEKLPSESEKCDKMNTCLQMCLAYLDLSDLLKLRLVNRRFSQLILSHSGQRSLPKSKSSEIRSLFEQHLRSSQSSSSRRIVESIEVNLTSMECLLYFNAVDSTKLSRSECNLLKLFFEILRSKRSFINSVAALNYCAETDTRDSLLDEIVYSTSSTSSQSLTNIKDIISFLRFHGTLIVQFINQGRRFFKLEERIISNIMKYLLPAQNFANSSLLSTIAHWINLQRIYNHELVDQGASKQVMQRIFHLQEREETTMHRHEIALFLFRRSSNLTAKITPHSSTSHCLSEQKKI